MNCRPDPAPAHPGLRRPPRIDIAAGLAAALLAVAAPPSSAGPVAGQGTWETTLHARDLDGDGAADADYDSTLNVTWLRDWSAGGYMQWADAAAWVAGLAIGGHTGWRMPGTVDTGAPGCDWAMSGTDCGYNPDPSSGELAHLYFVTLGNLSYYLPDADIGDDPQPGWGLSNTAHFVGMQQQSYWSGTEYAPAPANAAWTFALWGFQGPAGKINFDGPSIRTVALHDGDIGTPTAVPAPPALALALLALGLLVATRRPWRRRAAALLAGAGLALGATLPATAALVDRGGGLVYDPARDLTWLAAPALLPGPLSHGDAAQFALGFVHAGGSDWLLPLTSFVDAGCAGAVGFGCSDSQMALLFHQRLGGRPGESVFDASGDTPEELANLALFPALAADWFWSWQVADDGANTAFAFDFGNGEQAIRDASLAGRVLLVHAGDLGAPNRVDSPPTLPLVLAATAFAVVARRRVLRGPPPGARAPRKS